MRHLLTIMLLTCSLACTARKPLQRVCADSLPNTFSIRAMALPWVFGNAGGIGYTGGAEYGFRKVHAIGLDIAYNDLSNPEDPKYDSAAQTEKVPPRQYVVRRGIMLSYRYYLPYRIGKEDRYRPYLSLFARFGNVDYHPETGYISRDPELRDQVKYDERQYSLGLLYGVISPFTIGHLNLDINMGPFWKWKTAEDLRLENGVAVTHHLRSQNFGWRVGIDLALVCKRR